MPNSDLTPLERVTGFTEALREDLRAYWITSAEEFASLRRLDNARHPSALHALGVALGIDAATQDQLLAACLEASPRRAKEYGVVVELDVGAGLIWDDQALAQAQPYAPSADIPPSHALPFQKLPEVDQQGQRNTCVAFTMAAMYQLVTGDYRDLSEQFLFWGCKQVAPEVTSVNGTLPKPAIDALRTYGVCLESEWPYTPDLDLNDVTCGEPPPAALEAARRRRITSGGPLDSTKSAAVCEALAGGLPVLLGVKLHPFWTRSGQAQRGGRVRRALPGEDPRGGHAVCAVGYREDASAPGGGYVIFRNSWGGAFGSENLDGVGYGHMPYDVLDAINGFAYVIDPPEGAPAPVGGAAVGAGADLAAEARAALTRARHELDTLEGLLARLAGGER